MLSTWAAWELVALVMAVLLVSYRLRLLSEALRDWGSVRAQGITNGRRMVAQAQRTIQTLRLLGDLALVSVLMYAGLMPNHVSDEPWVPVVQWCAALVPTFLLLAAVREQRMRAALLKHLEEHR